MNVVASLDKSISRRQEAWRYLDLNAFLKQDFTAASVNSLQNTPDMTAKIKQHELAECYPIYCINGIYLLPDAAILPKGVRIVTADSVTELNEYFAANPLARLNQDIHQTSGSQGLTISIADDIQLEKPIHLIHMTTEESALKLFSLQNQWTIGKKSQVEIVESYYGCANTRYCHNIITQIHLAADAHLRHYVVQQEGNTSFHFNQQVIEQQDNSHYLNDVFTLAGGVVRNDKTVLLNAAGASAQLHGMYHAKGREQMANHLYLHHNASHNSSATHYKGLADEQGKGVFNGKIIVNPTAQKVSAQLQNKNLLLSPTAEINTKPELEIYNDDVLQCTHGASVGQLDDNALFYLIARGIDKITARHMLIQAFVMEKLSSIKNQTIKAYIEQSIEQRIADRLCQ